MKLTPAKSKKLRSALPGDATIRIAKKKKLTPRMVRYILAGKFKDQHGVIEEAIKIRDSYVQDLMETINKI